MSPPLPVLSDLDRGLRELGVPFAIVGALVPELLLEEGVVFNMAGFAHVVPHAVPTVINGGLTQTSSASPLASEAGMLRTTRDCKSLPSRTSRRSGPTSPRKPNCLPNSLGWVASGRSLAQAYDHSQSRITSSTTDMTRTS